MEFSSPTNPFVPAVKRTPNALTKWKKKKKREAEEKLKIQEEKKQQRGILY